MADERSQWLDQEAAERLLRGEPVEALDDPARAESRRLADALDSARTPAAPAGAELPGEAAALAAFREATAARAAATGPAPSSSAAELGPVVRLAAPVTRPVRRWGRSVRYGLAAAVAAATVGGVAVAAGTGFLPLVGPAPAASVTAVETPEPVVPDSRGTGEHPTPSARGPEEVEHPPGVSPSAGVGPPTRDATGNGTGEGEGNGSPSATSPPRTRPATGPDEGTSTKDKTLRACHDYLSGRLDETTVRLRLTDLLRADETLGRYCERVVSGKDAAPTRTAPPTPESGEKGEDGNRAGDENENGTGDADRDKSKDKDRAKGGDRDGGGTGTDDGNGTAGAPPQRGGLTTTAPRDPGSDARKDAGNGSGTGSEDRREFRR